jgi:DNA mismatch repair protein MutS
VFLNFAFIADEFEYCLPILTNDINFDVQHGRHPVVEKFLKSNNESFTGNDCSLNSEERIWLITGPNMAGKSTFLRQNAIIAILAHIGSFVPAATATMVDLS